jgi:hypothetical protein
MKNLAALPKGAAAFFLPDSSKKLNGAIANQA